MTRKIEAGDFRSAIRLANSEDTIADLDDDTYSALLSNHPAPHPCTCIPSVPPAPACIQVLPGVILAAIRSYPNGSAGGPDKFEPQHLKDLVQGMETVDDSLFCVLCRTFVVWCFMVMCQLR